MNADPLLFDPLARHTKYDLCSYLDTFEPKDEHDERPVKVAKLTKGELVSAILDLQRRMRSGAIKVKALPEPMSQSTTQSNSQSISQSNSHTMGDAASSKPRRETMGPSNKPKEAPKQHRRKTTAETMNRSASDIPPATLQPTNQSVSQSSVSVKSINDKRAASEHKAPSNKRPRERDSTSPPPKKLAKPSIKRKADRKDKQPVEPMIDWDELGLSHEGIPVVTPAKPSKPNPYQSDQSAAYQKLLTPTSQSSTTHHSTNQQISQSNIQPMDVDDRDDGESSAYEPDQPHFAIQAPRPSPPVREQKNEPVRAHQDDINMIHSMASEIRPAPLSTSQSSTQSINQPISHPKTPEAERFEKYQTEIKETGKLSTQTLAKEAGLKESVIVTPPGRANSVFGNDQSINESSEVSNYSINQPRIVLKPPVPHPSLYENWDPSIHAVDATKAAERAMSQPWWRWTLPALYTIMLMLAFIVLSRHEPLKSWLVEEPLFCPSNQSSSNRTMELNGHELPCLPCPPHGICSETGELTCSPMYVRQNNACKPDTVFSHNAYKLKEHFLHLLREQAGRAECGYTAQSSLKGSDLQHDGSVLRMVRSWVNLSDEKEIENKLEQYVGKALDLLKEDEDAVTRSGSHDRYRAVYQATETYRPLLCELRMQMMAHWIELAVLLASISWVGYMYWYVSRFFYRGRIVPQLVERIRDRLSYSNQEIAIDHLREEFWSNGDTTVWQRVVKAVERDLRIQGVRVNTGHIKRDGWVWVGPRPRDYVDDSKK